MDELDLTAAESKAKYYICDTIHITDTMKNWSGNVTNGADAFEWCVGLICIGFFEKGENGRWLTNER